ncbi:YceD family protein [Dawidia soli]|uniref:DUF177 domain-containing protein n=1 Tax=Dawidia soli TaxID=2782352 RepID=A0AAP2D5F6_9BACT|nr:DUF177 domain-containing protein [Dawidia soli]MBT1685653.1 DUF177 domain-containing protein [Dawidia soli]
MGIYSVNIIGLSNTKHLFEYEIGDAFFREYGTEQVSQGHFHAEVTLDKHETFIAAEFVLKGAANLVCDRSLEPFEFPIESRQSIVFKLGDRDEEMSDEIMMIHRDTATLELGQYLYEFIALAIPMKKLHPKFQQEEATDEDEDEAEGKIVYTSETKSDDDETDNDNNDGDAIDPRWDILKKLK